jgi:hypothetical protein
VRGSAGDIRIYQAGQVVEYATGRNCECSKTMLGTRCEALYLRIKVSVQRADINVRRL